MPHLFSYYFTGLHIFYLYNDKKLDWCYLNGALGYKCNSNVIQQTMPLRYSIILMDLEPTLMYPYAHSHTLVFIIIIRLRNRS